MANSETVREVGFEFTEAKKSSIAQAAQGSSATSTINNSNFCNEVCQFQTIKLWQKNDELKRKLKKKNKVIQLLSETVKAQNAIIASNARLLENCFQRAE